MALEAARVLAAEPGCQQRSQREAPVPAEGDRGSRYITASASGLLGLGIDHPIGFGLTQASSDSESLSCDAPSTACHSLQTEPGWRLTLLPQWHTQSGGASKAARHALRLVGEVEESDTPKHASVDSILGLAAMSFLAGGNISCAKPIEPVLLQTQIREPDKTRNNAASCQVNATLDMHSSPNLPLQSQGGCTD